MNEILGKYFPILDNGFISCVSVMGDDVAIEQAARVSYGAGTRKTSQTRGLLRYLKRMKHTSPFEMVVFKFHICCPIFVMRQHIRHRMSSTSEYSGRYSLMPMLFYTPEKDQFKSQSKINNQGRGEKLNDFSYESAVKQWESGRKQSAQMYEDLLIEDVARELARIDLPLSMYTQFFWKIDLHNLMHYLSLRVDSHAQYEIQEYGKLMAGMVKKLVPLSYEAWIDYDVCGARFSRMEIDILSDMLSVVTEKYNDNSGDELTTINSNGSTFFMNDLAKKHNLSEREAKEFIQKLRRRETPDFELDLSLAKSPEYFADKMAAAVPKIDKKPE